MMSRRWVGPLLLVTVMVLFHWKLVFTDQYTWLESPDLVNQLLPWYQFSSYELHHGRLPLWDPYMWGGQPLHAVMQAALANVLHWPLLAMPLDANGWLRLDALNWYYIFIRCLVALAMYALCRDLGRSKRAAVLGGIIYSLAGIEVTTDWPQMAHAPAWVALVMLFLLRVLRGVQPLRNSVLAGVSLGAAWLSGHHGYPTVLTLAVAGVWIYWISSRDARDRWHWRTLRLPAVCLVLMILVSAVQILPTLEYGKLAVRWVGSSHDPLHWNEKVPYHLLESLAMTPDGMFGFVFPYLSRGYDCFYGIAALGLALLGMAMYWREDTVRLLTVIGLGGLAFSLSSYTPLHALLYVLLPPVEKMREATFGTVLFSVAVAVLAAYALDGMLAGERSRWVKRFALGLAIFSVGLLMFGGMLVARRVESINQYNVFLLTAVYAGVLAIWLLATWNGKLSRGWATFVPVALVLIELTKGPSSLWHNRMDHSKPDLLKPLSEDAGMAAFLKNQSGLWRIEADIPYSFGTWWGLESMDGMAAGATANVADHALYTSRFREFMSVRFRVAEKPLLDAQSVVYEGPRGLKIFAYPKAGPRAFVVHRAEQSPGFNALRSRFQAPDFDPWRTVLLTTSPPKLEVCEDRGADTVKFTRRLPSRTELEVSLPCSGMLVLNDIAYPGWQVKVDGASATLYEVDGVVRGVVVPAGLHTVAFRFNPLSVRLGAGLTLAGLLLAGILIWRTRSINYV